MKHPVLVAFAIAAVVTLVLLGVVLGTHSSQEAPWALFFVLIAFPFSWFFIWLITNGVSWWRDTTKSE